MAEPRCLLYDIETAHNILAKFDLREEYTPHGNILQERYVVCAAWKWLGDKRTSAVSVLDDKQRYRKTPHDDYHVVKTLHRLMSEADVVIGHNARKFDNRWVNGRILKHGMAPLPPLTTIDTLTVARGMFFLNSNRLDYLGHYLGFGGKTSTPPGLWIDVLKGDQKAIRTMVDYNKRDVELLEQVYLKLRPFMANHPNLLLYVPGDGCPKCGGPDDRMQSRGTYRAETRLYRRWQCQMPKCMGWSRSLKAEKAVVARRPL